MKGHLGDVHDDDDERNRSGSYVNGGARRSRRRTTYVFSRAERISVPDSAVYWCSADPGAGDSLVVHGKPLRKHSDI